MSTFAEKLMNSIFTPGPTPPLLLATNAAFFALQLLLLALLAATRSGHFLALSVLCGGLWAAINWFAGEVLAAQAEERKRAAQADGAADSPEVKAARRVRASGAQRSAVEAHDESDGGGGAPVLGGGRRRRHKVARGSAREDGDSGTETEDLAAEHLLEEAAEKKGSISQQRRSSVSDVSGTDSEWDKVESEVEGTG